MRPSARILSLAVAVLLVSLSLAYASECTIPNSFTSGTPAVAAQVNANFDSVKNAVDDNSSRIAALETALTALQATITTQASTISTLKTTVSDQAITINTLEATVLDQTDTIDLLEISLASVENSEVMDLDSYLTVDTDSRGPLVTLSGANLQVGNGQGGTDSINGLGNLIVGYDEQKDPGSNKSGSHYLVLGTRNNYSRYGGIVAGYQNTASGESSSVSGGSRRLAPNHYNWAAGSQFEDF